MVTVVKVPKWRQYRENLLAAYQEVLTIISTKGIFLLYALLEGEKQTYCKEEVTPVQETQVE